MSKRADLKKVRLDNGKEMLVMSENKWEEHILVKELCEQALEINDHIMKVKTEMVGRIKDHLEKTAGQYGKHWKGNAKLFTINENYKIAVKISQKVKYTKEMAVAKQLYDSWLNSISENSKQEVKDVFKSTFNIDSKGNISKSKLMTLRKIKSENPDKQKADKIADAAIRHLIDTAYYTFYERDGKDWKRIEINFSALEV